ERALARAVRSDQAKPFAGPHLEVDAVERHKAAEALADLRNVKKRTGHQRTFLRPNQFWNRPTMPLGARITKPISTRPTIRRFTAEEIVTVATCWIVPSRIAPITGPSQVVVPPIIGIAMALT